MTKRNVSPLILSIELKTFALSHIFHTINEKHTFFKNGFFEMMVRSENTRKWNNPQKKYRLCNKIYDYFDERKNLLLWQRDVYFNGPTDCDEL